MPNIRKLTIQVLMIAICATILLTPAFAQRGRSSSESDLLKREEVRSELGLSDDQTKKLQELQESANVGKEFFEPYLNRIKEATDKDEQSKIRDEMNEAVSKQRLAFQTTAVKVLKPEQKDKLRGIFIQSAGMRIFSDPDVSKEYAITEEQQARLEELNNLRREASRSVGFDASEEVREKFATEWNDKLMAVLTKDQAARFEKESNFAPAPMVAESNSPAAGPAPEVRPAMQVPIGPVVSSFGAGSGESKRVEKFSFNFNGAPWEQVLQMYADGAGLTLELGQVPPGTFNHIDSNEYGPKRTLDILCGAMLRKGYIMIENDGFAIVLNVDNGIPPYLIPEASIEELLQISAEPVIGDHQLVTVKIPIEGMETGRAAQEIEPLVGPHGGIIALTESRILIVTDVGASLRRIHSLLTMAMGQSKPDALMFKSYFLKNMDAEEAQIAVMTQFGMQQGATNVSAAAEMQSRMQSRMQQQPSSTRGGAPTPRTPTPSGSTVPPIQVASDLRLNSLLVTGTAAQHTLVETILTSLDVSEGPDGQPLDRDRKGTYLEVYTVKSASADEVAKTLSAMKMPGVTVVNEDGRAGTIHIMATSRQHEEVDMLIRKLDGNGGAGGMVDVISLSQMDPLSAAATLRSLFYSDGDEAPTIETDLYRRLLIVRGDIDQITQIRKVLSEMGEDGSGVRQKGEGGTIRRFSLQGRNPEDFMQILQQAWNANETQKINIVVPNQSGPIRERRTTDELDGKLETPKASTPGDNLSGTDSTTIPDSQWRPWRQTIERIQNERKPAVTKTSDFISVKSIQEAAAPEAQDGNNPPLDVIVFGDELLLRSQDEAMLDRLEDLLDQLQQSMPFKPEYTVVYLKSADALEAADMLSQFFPSSSVATTSGSTGSSMLGSLGASMGSMGSSLMDMTGLSGLGASPQSLKIIPDLRTNSLFMTGPQSMIKDALAFLDVIDTDNIPTSLKDMQPHSIQLVHADVRDVETRIKELFKTYTEAQGGNKQNQQNPLAAMFGGGGGAASDPASQVRLMVEAHDQTNMLYVNCNQQLFEAIEGVVKEIDESTRVANPGIKVIQLKHADATMIQQSLTNLLPRVSVSSSQTTGGGGTPSASSSPAPAGSTNPQQDAINRAIQDRMRGGGGTTGSGTTRGGFGGFGGFGGQTGSGGGGGRTRGTGGRGR